MTSRFLPLFAWLLVVVAFFAWSLVFVGAWRINAELAEARQELDSAAANDAKSAASLRLRSLLRETEHDRAKIDAALAPDVLSVVKEIESIGDAAKVAIELGGAQTLDSDPKTKRANAKAVIVTVRAEGSFKNVIHAVSLFETLPRAAVVESYDIEHGGEEKRQAWRASVRIRITTTAALPV